MIESTLAIALVLGGLIFFHELGHFLVARSLGIGVTTFSLGFGPRLLKFRAGLTEYQLAAIPLGGYVQMVGESFEDDELPEGFTERHSFMKRPPLHRILVVLAGPVFNFLLAWFIYSGLFMVQGVHELMPVVGQVNDDSPAYHAGLHPGDQVLSIDGKTTRTFGDLQAIVSETTTEQTLTVVVDRQGTQHTFSLTPIIVEQKNIFGETVTTPIMGIRADETKVRIKEVGIGGSAMAGLNHTFTVSKLMIQGIGKLIDQTLPLDSVGGPIMIARMVSTQAKESFEQVLNTAAFISINLAILNLLPIPVLDGGHLLFFSIEGVTRRPVGPKIRELTTKLGLLFLLALMGLALYNDIRNWLF